MDVRHGHRHSSLHLEINMMNRIARCNELKITYLRECHSYERENGSTSPQGVDSSTEVTEGGKPSDDNLYRQLSDPAQLL